METQLRKCSMCRSTQLLDTYFKKNRKGEYLKTCKTCRARSVHKSIRCRAKKNIQNDALLNDKNRKCSSCAATQLLDASFEKNRKGEYFKTCNHCRNSSRDKQRSIVEKNE